MAYMKLRHMIQKNDCKCGQNYIKRTPVLPKRKKCPGEWKRKLICEIIIEFNRKKYLIKCKLK